MAGSNSGGPDKFLIGIVAGIVVLVILALVVVLAQPEPAFRSDDSPEAAVHNYLMALSQDEFGRAYDYLSPTLAGYPADVGVFLKDVNNNEWRFRRYENATWTVGDAVVAGDTAVVEVTEVIAGDMDIFEGGVRKRLFEMTLDRVNGQWKLVDGDSYWVVKWSR